MKSAHSGSVAASTCVFCGNSCYRGVRFGLKLTETMRFVLTILFVTVIGAGCSSPSAPSWRPRPRSARSEYLQGYMDGYLAAFPDKPYRYDGPAYCSRPYHTEGAYTQGWRLGHDAGRDDERQRD